MPRYKLLPNVGNHGTKGPAGKFVTHTSGAIFEDEEEDLDIQFPNKFKRLKDEKKPVKKEEKEEEEEDVTQEESPEEEEQDSPKGVECTDQFQRASKGNLRVFRVVSRFFVYDQDNLSKPVNDKGLKKEEVSDFIDEYIVQKGKK